MVHVGESGAGGTLCSLSWARGRRGRSPGGVQQVPGALKAWFQPSPPPPRSRRPQCLLGHIPAGGRAVALHTVGWTSERTSLVIGSVQAPVFWAQGLSSHSRADWVNNQTLAPISADRKWFTLSEVDDYVSCSGMRSHVLEHVECEGALVQRVWGLGWLFLPTGRPSESPGSSAAGAVVACAPCSGPAEDAVCTYSLALLTRCSQVPFSCSL